jgi:lysophospholipase L1-like esterase
MPSISVARTAAIPEHEFRRRAALLAAALLAALALILGAAVAGPADAASAAVPAAKPPDKPGGGGGGGTTTELEYAAVGDSFAAGTGAGSYLSESGSCYRSSKSYPKVLDADRKAKLLLAASNFTACSGASTTETAAQVGGISTTAKVVTVTVGGNDVGFADVMRNCFVFPSSSCQSYIDAGAAIAASQEFRDRVGGVITAIRDRTEPDARVIVAGYPRLFDPTSSYAWAEKVNAETIVLNDVIESVALANGAVFVDVEEAFADHGLGSSSPWINGVRYPFEESFHPNATGQAAYASAIRTVPVP